MSEAFRLICKTTRRAADVEGDMVTLGRMAPDLRIFGQKFPAQIADDPWSVAKRWLDSGKAYDCLPVCEVV